MIKLYQQLENVLKIRILSNEDIIPAIKKLMEMGKLDKPKEIAMFAIILDRLGKIEDEAVIEESLKGLTEDSTSVPQTVQTASPGVKPVLTVSNYTPEDTSTPETTISVPEVASDSPDASNITEDKLPEVTLSDFTPETVKNPPTSPVE